MRSMKSFPHTLRAALLFGLALVAAQVSVSAQTARDVLTNFPDSQVVLYVNAQRILNDAAPRVVPQKKLDEAFEKMKKDAMGFDVRTVHHVAVGVRFKGEMKPGAIPEFVALIRGDINPDSLLSLAKMAMSEMHTEETRGSRTISIFKLSKPKPAEDNQAATADGQPQPVAAQQPESKGPPISEIAAVVMDANTIIVGIPDYVRAAVDAESDAQLRLKGELVELAARNPDDLVSLFGEIPESLMKSLPNIGGSQNSEMTKLLGSIRQLQSSISMTQTDFGIQTILRTDTPESARSISGMVAIGLRAAEAGIQKDLDKTPKTKVKERRALETALGVVRAMTNTANGNELTITTSVPQKLVADIVQHEMNKSQATQKPKPTTKRTTRRKSTGRKA